KTAIDLVLGTDSLAHFPCEPLVWLNFYSAPRARPFPKEKPARAGSSPVRNPRTIAAGGAMSNRKHAEKPSFPPLSGRPAIEGEAFDNAAERPDIEVQQLHPQENIADMAHHAGRLLR